MKSLSSALSWCTLFIVLAAPAVAGCQPPWAWGFLLGVLFFCAALFLLAAFLMLQERQALELLFSRPLLPFTLLAFSALGWASGMYLYDQSVGGEGGRYPALAIEPLAFAWAFAASFLLGLRWGTTGRRLRRLMRLVLLACAAYASIGIFQRLGWWPPRVLEWTLDAGRFSGIYTNANRYAVLLSIGWSCGVALLAMRLTLQAPHAKRRTWLEIARILAPWVCGLAIISAGISYSQSRLTMLSLALVFSLAVVLELRMFVRARRDEAKRFSWEESAASFGYRPKPKPSLFRSLLMPAALILPGLLVLSGLLFFSGSSLAARWSELADFKMPDPTRRGKVFLTGWELLKDAPLLGHGQGSFETAFRLVQPPELGGHWLQVHSDWLQLGIELGVPGLLLALAATGAWCWLWWRQGKNTKRYSRFRLLSYGGMAVAVPLLCCVADFPLREPATAMLFFFLAGALAAAQARAVARATPPAPPSQGGENNRRPRMVLLRIPVLAVLFFYLGVHTFQIGAAVARSPWRGLLYPPTPKASDVAVYRAAVTLAPGFSELLFPFARAQWAATSAATPEERPAAREELLRTLDQMEAQNPRDHRVPWLQAYVAAADGAMERAADLLDQSVELAPAFPQLREQALNARLFELVPRLGPYTPARQAELDKVFRHMRHLLRIQPHTEDDMLAALSDAGVQVHEIADFWKGEEPEEVLARTRYWIGIGGWYMARQELAWAAEHQPEHPWVFLLQGRVALQEKRLEDGLAGLRRGFQEADRDQAVAMERWLVKESERIPVSLLTQLAKREKRFFTWPKHVVLAWSERLVAASHRREAWRLLLALADNHPDLDVFQKLAELSKSLNDAWSARAYAERAWERSDRSNPMKAWLDTFPIPEPTPPAPLP